MLVITGATGQLGGIVIEYLLETVPANQIAAVVRTPAKAAALAVKGIDIRQGDYNDKEALVKAFAGADKLFFVSNTDIPNRLAQHQNVVDAALEADVKHVVYTSFLTAGGDDILGQTHLKTEEMIKSNGMTYTFLRDGFYMDPYLVEVEIAIENGVYRSPVGSSGVSLIARRDVARAAAAVLAGEGHRDKAYELTGPESVTPAVFARVASAISGKDIPYEPITWEELEDDYRGRDYDDERIQMAILLDKIVATGALGRTSADVEKLTGKKPMSFLAYSREQLEGK